MLNKNTISFLIFLPFFGIQEGNASSSRMGVIVKYWNSQYPNLRKSFNRIIGENKYSKFKDAITVVDRYARELNVTLALKEVDLRTAHKYIVAYCRATQKASKDGPAFGPVEFIVDGDDYLKVSETLGRLVYRVTGKTIPECKEPKW